MVGGGDAVEQLDSRGHPAMAIRSAILTTMRLLHVAVDKSPALEELNPKDSGAQRLANSGPFSGPGTELRPTYNPRNGDRRLLYPSDDGCGFRAIDHATTDRGGIVRQSTAPLPT